MTTPKDKPMPAYNVNNPFKTAPQRPDRWDPEWQKHADPIGYALATRKADR